VDGGDVTIWHVVLALDDGGDGWVRDVVESEESEKMR